MNELTGGAGIRRDAGAAVSELLVEFRGCVGGEVVLDFGSVGHVGLAGSLGRFQVWWRTGVANLVADADQLARVLVMGAAMDTATGRSAAPAVAPVVGDGRGD